MWIFTKDGFFSAVHDKYCGKDELMIRARAEKDLERLRFALDVDEQILHISHADYAWRMKVTKSKWATYVYICASAIDYSNVKGNIIPKDNNDIRHDAMMGVWSAMFTMQKKIMKKAKK